MGKLEKYSSYKDSGVKWIGEKPSHWESFPLKSCTKIKSINNVPDLELLSVYLDLGVIKFNDVEQKRTNATSLDLSAYQLVEPGDFVLNNQQAWRGSVGVSFHKGIVSPAYIILELSDKFDSKFANYYFRNGLTVSQYLINSKGVGTIQRNLYWNSLKQTYICIPPKNEQIQIASFLDEKTTQIDEVISQKEKLIELLKERKQIVINDAVTKGLDKDVEFVNSNLKNFGYIPKHWKIMFNRRLFREENRKNFNKIELPLSLSQVDGVIPSGEMKERSLSPSHRDNFKLCLPDDLVVNRFKGHLGVFFRSDFRGIITFHYGVFKPSNFVNTKYYEYLFHTQYYKNIYAGASNGMTIGLQNLSNQNFYDVKSIVPPIDEQNEIVNFIEQEETKINKTIQFQVEVITKLKEYKASLIDSVVTGKVRVS